ncbi:LD-carboxypeptidase [Vicingaceae bacterium]|nr:LD-carboxypeptidase [Vicingaceae bacterium]MDC0004759.1 LD-carboxypeptidase [bacterium]MDC0004771.1 LD-carboxypeptidase [bacterium]MDC1450966.1 LD-carboxypeptidase [Vicingaceae bacterium]
MLQPKALKKGDVITIISTARKISKEELAPAIRVFESWGLTVILGKNLFAQHHQFAGIAEQRIEDLQAALDDSELKAVVFARGGYGTVQLIDHIDFSAFQKNPKWLVGYSDVTVLHNHINQNFGIETLHANMPISFPKIGENESTKTIHEALFGNSYKLDFQIEEGSLSVANEEHFAPIVGGNLSIIYSLTGTLSQLDTKGKFLFIEDLDEYLYHIDRMMMNLKRAGLFDGCIGVLVGGMSDMNDNTIPFGKSAKEIIADNLKEFNIPIIFGLPSGHIERNLALIMNRETQLKIDINNNATLIFHGGS